jgi:hypothetical protein
VNEDNLSNVRREASRHFRNNKREYLKDKLNELKSNSKNKNIRDLYRGINEFKMGYQPRTNLVRDEKGDLLADPRKIVNRWMDYFCHLLNAQRVKIYKTIILPPVLYGCETWSLTLNEEYRLRVFENRVLRRIFGPKRDGITGEWRKLHNEECHIYIPPQILVDRSNQGE